LRRTIIASKFTALFTIKDKTTNTVRYQEVNDKGEPMTDGKKIGTLYVQKSVFGGDKPPERLSVSVEVMS
jgi:hypothetical protein